MPDRPNPPEGYETWIEFILGAHVLGDARVYAHAELDKLREKAAQAGKCQRCQALLHTMCPDCAGVREPL